MAEAAYFPNGCVASPHHLASSAGARVLAEGGNAVDAAIAANLTLGVVMPFACGYGGDLFAILWDGEVHAYAGAGRAPEAATADLIRQRAGAELMPAFGPHSVTVPGAVDAWFALLNKWGTRSFGALAAPAVELARDGFALSSLARYVLAHAERLYAKSPDWNAVYAGAAGAGFLRQADLAKTITTLADDGPDPFYTGPIAAAIVGQLQKLGGVMSSADLASHRGEWVTPMRASYRDVEVLELPPPTQGVTALEALRILDYLGPLPADPAARQHMLIEASKLALSDRGLHVTDPDHMTIDPEELLSDSWIARRAAAFDPDKAGSPTPARPALGGTIYLTAADRDGCMVSLIQSNFMGFGSGVTVPGLGINLQNRGGYFSLDPDHVDVIAPRKRPLHTLIPALAIRDEKPAFTFGSMGGDNQAHIQLQLLQHIVDDRADLQFALSAPRWNLNATDWTITVEQHMDPAIVRGLEKRGHVVSREPDFAHAFGWSQAIGVARHGYRGATDPRPDGAVTGH